MPPLSVDRVVTIDGVPHRYFGRSWGRLHFLSCDTGLRFRLPRPGGASLEPDDCDFADLCSAGRIVLAAKTPTIPPRRPRGGGRRWQRVDRPHGVPAPSSDIA